jgi:hypothetical protein
MHFKIVVIPVTLNEVADKEENLYKIEEVERICSV